MSIVLGYHKEGQDRTAVAQDGARVGLYALDGAATVPPVIERRNGVIGNGPTAGDGVFDFRYGPFTGGYPEAGIIHYYTYGERILSVEIDLSKKHRGIERALQGMEIDDAVRQVAGLCGNFAVAHTVAFCRAVESALAIDVSEEAQRLRIAALELERIYNHIYVIMRLATAAAQKVLAAHLAALFEETLRITELFSGRRGGSTVTLGGLGLGSFSESAGRPPSPPLDRLTEVALRVKRVQSTFSKLYERSLDSRNYLDRLHRTAIVSEQRAAEDSLTGPSLRACGVAWDLRVEERFFEGLHVRTKAEGDALARMEVRAEEIVDSCAIVADQLQQVVRAGSRSRGALIEKEGVAGEKGRSAVSQGLGAAESPSGTVAWLVSVDEGRVGYATASSPSVFGFQTYADAIVGNIFTDVPFAIESFGLSFADAGR